MRVATNAYCDACRIIHAVFGCILKPKYPLVVFCIAVALCLFKFHGMIFLMRYILEPCILHRSLQILDSSLLFQSMRVRSLIRPTPAIR